MTRGKTVTVCKSNDITDSTPTCSTTGVNWQMAGSFSLITMVMALLILVILHCALDKQRIAVW
ncbi:hypothetical protein CXB77_00730 [Chromatium okenii]|uniref:Uncharacterized protein n=2 Tax=Chromatium okenii TaxID=61644 RepID=A0A2S7XV13_9GAMM|nr:hypothetical protein CXB77_00730 [Chromatium okenii]